MIIYISYTIQKCIAQYITVQYNTLWYSMYISTKYSTIKHNMCSTLLFFLLASDSSRQGGR